MLRPPVTISKSGRWGLCGLLKIPHPILCLFAFCTWNLLDAETGDLDFDLYAPLTPSSQPTIRSPLLESYLVTLTSSHSELNFFCSVLLTRLRTSQSYVIFIISHDIWHPTLKTSWHCMASFFLKPLLLIKFVTLFNEPPKRSLFFNPSSTTYSYISCFFWGVLLREWIEELSFLPAKWKQDCLNRINFLRPCLSTR